LPDGGGLVEGPVDLHLRGSLGEEWDGGGTVLLSQGKVARMRVTEWGIPGRFHFGPSRQNAEVHVSDSVARVGAGRAPVRGMRAGGGGGMRVETSIRVQEGELRDLGALLGDFSSYAQGKLSGRVDLSGSNVRSVNDLGGEIQASFRDAQALQLPVLRQLSP